MAYLLNGQTNGWSFAADVMGHSEPVSTYFGHVGTERPRALPHFDGLVHCMEDLFINGRPDYPVERTLLTTCTLSLLFESRAWKKRLETPELAIAYTAPRDTYFQRS